MISIIRKFGASWCAPCKAVDKVLLNVPASITVHRHDVEEESELADKYKVTSLPTLVFEDAEGNEITRRVGNTTLSKIQEILSENA